MAVLHKVTEDTSVQGPREESDWLTGTITVFGDISGSAAIRDA